MRNLKKFLAVLVAVVMMATMMIPAFAATPSDVMGTDYEAAVARLVALGVITGRPDGTFAPDESISRAEFAAVVIRALGYESVAAAAKGTTKFADVAPTFWASGYINLAVSLGITKGKPDGTFAPNDKVLFEEAVTMIVRALGMDALAVAKGGYPTGYLVQGKEFTKSVKGVAGLPAMRGIVAQLVDNAKDIKIWEQTGFGDSQKYEAGKENFLTRLGMHQEDDAIVTAIPSVDSSLEDDEFIAGEKFTVVEGTVDFEAVLGKKVEIWTNEDGEVVLATVKTAEADLIAVKEIKSVTYDANTDITKIKVKNTSDVEKEYTVKANDAVWNLGVSDAETVMSKILTPVVDDTVTTMDVVKEVYDITLTLDGGKIVFVNALTFGLRYKLSADPTINTVKDIIRVTGLTENELQNGDKEVARLVIIKDGEEAEAKDLKKHDILMVAENLGDLTKITDNRIYIVATSDTVVGELESASPNDAAAKKVKVDSTSYDVSAFLTTYDVSAIAIGDTVKLYLDAFGKVFYVSDESDTSADTYGIITAVDISESFGEFTAKVKMLLANGDKVTYTVDSNVDTNGYLDTNAPAGLDAGDAPDINILVKFGLNSDGEVSVIVKGVAGAAGAVAVVADRGTIGGASVKTDVSVFNLIGSTNAKAEAWTWDDVNDGNAVVKYKILDGVEIAAVMFDNASLVTSSNYAIVSSRSAVKDGYSLEVLNKDGESVLITTSRLVYANANAVISYVVDTKGKVSSITDLPAVTGDLEEISGNRIKVAGNFYYVTDDTLYFYDKDGNSGSIEELTKADLYKNMVVSVYEVTDDVVVLVVEKM